MIYSYELCFFPVPKGKEVLAAARSFQKRSQKGGGYKGAPSPRKEARKRELAEELRATHPALQEFRGEAGLDSVAKLHGLSLEQARIKFRDLEMRDGAGLTAILYDEGARLSLDAKHGDPKGVIATLWCCADVFTRHGLQIYDPQLDRVLTKDDHNVVLASYAEVIASASTLTTMISPPTKAASFKRDSSRFWIVTGPFREGAVPIHIYNEGLLLFFFDESKTDEIREKDPKIVWGLSRKMIQDTVTQSLLASGDLLLSVMQGDGGIDLDVVAGLPLTEEELQSYRWYPVQCGFLRLDSGRLAIHSYNTLPMGDNVDTHDKGGFVSLPPGSYEIRIYRKDWDAAEKAGLVGLEDASQAGIKVYGKERVDEVVVLTRSPRSSPPKGTTNILFPECLGP